MHKFTKSKPLTVLNVGTKILLADVMDQYLRSMGEVKTYYTSKLSSAHQHYMEKKPDIIFCEQAFPDGSALELIDKIGGLVYSKELYFVLAAETMTDDLVSLAIERGIDEILVKPFSNDHINDILGRLVEKKSEEGSEWALKLREGSKAHEEKRFQEAEEIYTRCAKENLENIPVLIECAEFFLRRNNFSVANQISERILGLAPDNVRAMHIAGVSLKRLGRLKESAERLRAANSFSPMNSLRHAELAETYLLMAEEEIQAALKTETENPQLIIMKARYQLLRKDYAGTVVYLDAKQAFLAGAAKKDAELIMGVAKKFGGIK